MSSNFNINQIQSYIKQKRFEQISLQKPGYEIWFYSRANQTADIIPYISGTGQVTPVANNGVKAKLGGYTIPCLQGMESTPNAFLTSENVPGSVASVQSIKVNNTVNSQTGSTAQIVLANPEGIDYFNKTIGTIGLGTPTTTDYDSSFGLPINVQRIGDQDTVIIRLKNFKTFKSKDPRYDCETVFRGVIKGIHRSSSPLGGSLLTLDLGDFSEVLRNFTALPLGLFSTISFSATGRGLVANLTKYANRLATGDWRFLGTDVSQSFANTAEAAADQFLNQNGLSVDENEKLAQDAINADNHKMYVPTFFYLEFSNQYPDISPPINSNQQNQLNAADPDINNVGTGKTDTGGAVSNAYNEITNSAVQSVINFLQVNNAFKQTPEDTQTIQAYQIALRATEARGLNKVSQTIDVATSAIMGAEKYAWILSDLYLDRGLITFEHKKIWSVMTETANRAMREVYFDFAPKLSPNAKHAYDTAKVSEYNANTSLPDVHPNIGILKYRLSPCMLAYDENNNSEIFQWSISNDDIIEENSAESSEEVFTAVFGFGSGLTPSALGTTAKDIAVGQNKGLLAFAQSIDPKLEQRLGYRFMTDHDQKIQIPILMYLTSYASLMQSEMNMFTAQISVPGNPTYRPGSIIRLKDKREDYYCTDVTHDWNINNGYITHLNLAFGHTSGILPSALTGGYPEDSVADNEQCQLKSKALSKYIPVNTNIGGVNVHCLVSSMSSFMTCGVPTNQLIQATSPEAQNANPKSTSYVDWIEYYNGGGSNSSGNQGTVTWQSSTTYPLPAGFQPYPFDNLQHQIINEIQYQGLDKYNVTYNLVKNIVRKESSFIQNIVSGDGGYGLFQITPGNSNYIYNPISAISKAMQILKYFFTAKASPGCSGIAFLNAVAGYNGSPSYTYINYAGGATKPYVNSVLGDAQVARIVAGDQSPKNSKTYYTGSGLTCAPAGMGTKWPFPVYGPIGERLDTYKSRHPGVKDKDAKAALNNYNTGMTEAVNYITGLCNKYKSQPLPGAGVNGTPASSVDGNNLMQKVIAAWFSNEDLASLTSDQADFLQKSISGITTLYQECQKCTGQTAAPQLGTDYSKNVALSQIDFIYPCKGNAPVTSPFGPRNLVGGAGKYHLGIDIGATEFYACADGEVIQVGNTSNAGYEVVILHSNKMHGVCTRFLDMNPSGLPAIGTQVKQGQFIGTAGAGEGTGLHIHVELRYRVEFDASGNLVEETGVASHFINSGEIYGGHFSGIAVDPQKYFRRA